jgi:membrane-bound lytic murein transglycosylase F
MNSAEPPDPSPRQRRARYLVSMLAVLLATILLVLSTCSPRRSVLDEVQATGVLRVATVNSPTTYYLGAAGEPTGFEYDLVKGLADQLKVRLEIVVTTTPPEALALVKTARVHFAAAGIGVSPGRAASLRFTKPLLQVVPVLVYRKGTPRPKNLGDLSGHLLVVKDSTHTERLRELQARYPDLKWDETGDEEPEELLYKVANGDLDYTIAYSDLVAINQRYYPELRVAFTIAEAQDIAWAFPRQRDDSLMQVADGYLQALGGAELARLRDRYFGHINQVDTHGALTLATHVDTRLPKYRSLFETAANQYGLDWRLLAAIGYQESHWDPAAVSPTGVLGIMQITAATAAFLKIPDRTDPAQSIWGGARYIAQLAAQLPAEITDPDRTWMALAAYNMGLGHLYDARKLTDEQGGDPNRWLDVRNSLPLLTQSKWHTKTKHGYARGHQAVIYVGNVRTYYDMLVWITGSPAQALPQEVPPDTEVPAPPDNPLNIRSPVL